jgi:methyl-accepting chemotaxis protein
VINGEFYELKTITSHKVDKIEDRILKAESQAENIVIDIRKTTNHYRRASQMVKQTISGRNHIKRVLLITKEKDKKVLDFKK